MDKLKKEITEITKESICDSSVTYNRILKRISEESFTRDENPSSHFCAYFLPFDPKTGKVFVVYHKKADKWLVPGGHIDKGEGLLDTLNREISEELGVSNFYKETPAPFLLTITPIKNNNQVCKEHFDVWYLMETDGSDFNVDPREFLETKWLDIPSTLEIVTDPATRTALEYLMREYETTKNL